MVPAVETGFEILILEDACVYQCAQKTRADFIITRDTNGFKQSLIPVLAPGDFFK